MLTDRELERYRRQVALFGEEAQERLADARVVIVGAGGDEGALFPPVAGE